MLIYTTLYIQNNTIESWMLAQDLSHSCSWYATLTIF